MLHVFRSLITVDGVRAAESLSADERAYRQDTLSVGWEARSKARGRRRSDAGVEFGTALPRGTVLHDGDCLVLTELTTVIRVVALEERVFVIAPRSAPEWALFAYHIGNSHQPLMINSEGLICPEMPGMEQVLTYHGIPFSRERRVFTPATGTADHRHQL